MVWQVASPRPVPLPLGLVVKNASNKRAFDFVGHAGSRVADAEHHIIAGNHARVDVRVMFSSSVTLLVAMVSLPPLGMASRALTTRFISTCPT